jgi:hypothetical protein
VIEWPLPIRGARWILAGAAASLALAAGAAAIEITEHTLSAPAFSPNGDGAFDDVTWGIGIAGGVPPVGLRGDLYRGEALAYTILDTTLATGDSLLSRTWSGRDIHGAAVANGVYDLIVRATDATEATAHDTIAVHVDLAPPAFESVALAGPQGAFRNGDYIAITCVFGEAPDSVWADFAEIDSDGVTAVEQHDAVTFSVLHRIDPDNPRGDADNLVITVSARDSLHNVGENDDVAVCLSNVPPIFASAALVDASRAELPDSTAYTAGDPIRAVARFHSAVLGLSFDIDFEVIDSEFILNPGEFRRDTLIVTDVPDSEQVAPGYAYRLDAYYSYRLSLENARADGFYTIPVGARLGCAETRSDTSIVARLADLNPAAPIFDPVAAEAVRADTVEVTGRAPGAVRVRILRDDGPAVEADVGEADARFEAEVPLAPGRNLFTAFAIDSNDRTSPPSAPIEIFRVEDVSIDIPEPFRPGDTIRVALLERPVRIDLDIFDMAGHQIVRETAGAPGEVQAFTWDGRNRSGDRVLSGPYVARVTVHRARAKEAIHRAIVLTRK